MPVPYPVFRAALDNGDLDRIRMLAREMGGPMRLEDALRVVLLMRDGDEDRYEAACVRWIGRFALEGRNLTLQAIQEAAAALDTLPMQPQASMDQLQQLCVAHGVARQGLEDRRT